MNTKYIESQSSCISLNASVMQVFQVFLMVIIKIAQVFISNVLYLCFFNSEEAPSV